MDEWITHALVHTHGNVWAAAQIIIASGKGDELSRKRQGDDEIEGAPKFKSARTNQSRSADSDQSQSPDSDQYPKPKKIEDIPVETQKIILKDVIMATPPKKFVDLVMRLPFLTPDVDFDEWFQSKEDPRDELTIVQKYRRKWYIPVVFNVLRPLLTGPFFYTNTLVWGSHDPFWELKLYLPADMSFEDAVKQFEEKIQPENIPSHDPVPSDLIEQVITPPNIISSVIPDKSVPLKNIMAFYKKNLDSDTISKWVKHGYENPTENLLIFYDPKKRYTGFNRILITEDGVLSWFESR